MLQQLDGVEPAFLWQLNQDADQPGLYLILNGDTACARQRAERRGLYSRVHRGGNTVGEAEAALYAVVAVVARLEFQAGDT